MAKKRYESYKLNGKYFTRDLKGGTEPQFTTWDYSCIWSAYERPSQTKIAIWEDWADWFYSNNGRCWVDSRNGFVFTISGTVVDQETGELLGVHITPSYNYCWSITD